MLDLMMSPVFGEETSPWSDSFLRKYLFFYRIVNCPAHIRLRRNFEISFDSLWVFFNDFLFKGTLHLLPLLVSFSLLILLKKIIKTISKSNYIH